MMTKSKEQRIKEIIDGPMPQKEVPCYLPEWKQKLTGFTKGFEMVDDIDAFKKSINDIIDEDES